MLPCVQGEWTPKQIDNPNYKGAWVHPEIDNPDYKSDPELYKRDEICALGFDLWQVKSGTIFDNVLITDDPEEARKFGEEIWKPTFVSAQRNCRPFLMNKVSLGVLGINDDKSEPDHSER